MAKKRYVPADSNRKIKKSLGRNSTTTQMGDPNKDQDNGQDNDPGNETDKDRDKHGDKHGDKDQYKDPGKDQDKDPDKERHRTEKYHSSSNFVNMTGTLNTYNNQVDHRSNVLF